MELRKLLTVLGVCRITFSGEVRTTTPGLTCVTSQDDRIRCAAVDPKPWRANVTSVTWK